MSISQEGSIEDGFRGSSGIRMAAHRTSHTEFLNWIVYFRDLCPDITPEQRRTCAVCEVRFRDRRSMLRHIPTCFKLSNGFYSCIHCNNREKIGRYHMNRCREVHIYQDNWLKRILSFRSSKILVDVSETDVVEAEDMRAPWERIELPAESIAELDATRDTEELAGTEITSTSFPTPELEGDWAPLELDDGHNSWGPVDDVSAWLPADHMAELEAGWPALDIYGGSIPIHEMPAWQPQQLAKDGYNVPSVRHLGSDLDSLHQEDYSQIALSSPINSKLSAQNSTAFDNERQFGSAEASTFVQEDMPRPNLWIDTSTAISRVQCNHGDTNMTAYHDGVKQQSRSIFGAAPRIPAYNDDTTFPSPPTSPISNHENYSPVSPIANSLRSFSTPRSSRYSSLSSLLMEDTPLSSFSLSEVTLEHSNSKTLVFEDRAMCLEPDEMEFLPTSSNENLPASTDVIMYFEPEPEVPSMSLAVPEEQSTTLPNLEGSVANVSVEEESVTIEYVTTPSGGNGLDHLLIDAALHASSSSSPKGMGNHWDTINWFEAGNFDTNYSQITSSSYSPTSSTKDTQQSLSSASVQSSSPEQSSIQPPRSEGRRSLTRSPAFRAVYKCTYGSCDFEPTGKKAYHKRTLQRHQEKCLHSPLPRERKPCKCTFPGCNKGFSRSDGLNAHRKTSGHGVKIELQIIEANEANDEVLEDAVFL